MRQVGFWKSVIIAVCVICYSQAVSGSATAVPERIVVSPSEIRLDSKRAYRQIVVTGYFKGSEFDLSSSAKILTVDSNIVHLKGSRITPAGNGHTTVKVIAAGKTVEIPVSVSNFTKPDPVRFTFEALPILTKQGCATGSCHGSPHGKGGFSLSLLGYDPQIDRISLTRDGLSRRVNVMEPAESLMMKKPLLEIPHVGGKRLRKTDTGYSIIREWIDEGADIAIPTAECIRITITPGSGRVLHAPYLCQQISVVANYSDGSTRDVSAISTYESSNTSVATVDADGLITGHGRGQTAISVRYLDKLQSVNITLVEDIPGFVWKKTPENNFVDKLVDDKLKQLQYLPSPTCSDQVFIRRLSLDLTGMLPSVALTRAFLKDSSPDKRENLIRNFLNTEEYARFWALKKADLMRVSLAKLKQKEAEGFSRWIVDAVRSNMPYDQFARTILTSSGSVEKSPSAGYFLAIPTTEERTELTAQVFIGSRLECAKCHNHPFENWTMRDYYSLGAVFARTQASNGTVRLARTGESLLPTTKEVMMPWGLPKHATIESSNMDRRSLFVEWLTKKGNPFFAKVEVNRIWSELTGRGIVEPVDDFRSSNPPSNKLLLDALAQEFERSGYDRKQIIKLICSSQTYQRSTQTNKFNESDDVLFSHARIRELTAEQLKDALGLTTRSLPSTDTVPSRRMQLESQLQDETRVHETTYVSWLNEQKNDIHSLPYWLGSWKMAGPYKISDDLNPVKFDTEWTLKNDIKDGIPFELRNEPDQVYFLRRTIHCAAPTEVEVKLSSNAASMWLNGKLLSPKLTDGEYRIKVKLESGDNNLILKSAHKMANSNIQVNVSVAATAKSGSSKKLSSTLPFAFEILANTASLSKDENQTVHDYFIESDTARKALQDKIDGLDNRMEYATQRPYPEASAFTITFGQPLRETACTCERRKSPTLLQALELLNGDTSFKMAEAGSEYYSQLDNKSLVEELYLSGLSRLPSGKELDTSLAYIANEPIRKNAVTDLIWTLMNTQEFLFQH